MEIVLGAIGTNIAPALKLRSSGEWELVCGQMDLILGAENRRGGRPEWFGNTEGSTASEGGDW